MRPAVATVLGAVLGFAAAHALFLGSWTLGPWALGGLALGWWNGRPGAPLAGALYGFALSFVFMLANYSGTAPVLSRTPFFALLGLFGAGCGAVLTLLGARLRRPARERAP